MDAVSPFHWAVREYKAIDRICPAACQRRGEKLLYKSGGLPAGG